MTQNKSNIDEIQANDATPAEDDSKQAQREHMRRSFIKGAVFTVPVITPLLLSVEEAQGATNCVPNQCNPSQPCGPASCPPTTPCSPFNNCNPLNCSPFDCAPRN